MIAEGLQAAGARPRVVHRDVAAEVLRLGVAARDVERLGQAHPPVLHRPQRQLPALKQIVLRGGEAEVGESRRDGAERDNERVPPAFPGFLSF